MNYPLVSIIIPYRINRGFLWKTLQSVYQQSYQGPIEIILSNHDNSVSYNINRAIEIASGDYIKYLCDDDMLPINSIQDSVDAIQGYDFINGNATAFFMEGKFKGQKKEYIPQNKYPTFEQLMVYNSIHGGSLMYKREVFEQVGLFNEQINCAEEYEFNLRCLKHGLKIGYCNKNLYLYRRHGKQKSLGNGINQMERQYKIFQIRESLTNKKT